MEISATPHLYYGRRTNYNCEKINEYSLKNGELTPNSGLKFLNEAMLNKDNMNIDLLEGMEPGKQKLVGGGDQTLNRFCEWLMSVNGRDSSLQEALHGERFVAHRGLFLRLALSTYKDKDKYDLGFIVAATKYKGVSFLCEFLTEAKIEFEATERQKPVEGFHHNDKRIYASFRFEKLAVSADDEERGMPEEEETAAAIEPTTKYIAVFAGKLDSSAVPALPILCISNVDCALADTREFIALKTQYNALGVNRGFWHKALNWYVRSFLTGTKEFVVGLHNEFETDRHGNPVKSQLSGRDQCILQRVEKHPLGHLLVWARQNNVDVCLAFLHAFLAKLKAKLDKEPEGTILVAERPTKSLDFTFKTIPIGDEEGQRRWEVLSQEFKEFGWQ